MKSPHCCLKDTHHINNGTQWRCYWTHTVSSPDVSWDWPLPPVWLTLNSEALKKASDHFHKDINNWFVNKRSVWFRDYLLCSPCHLATRMSSTYSGKRPISPAFTLQFSFCWPEGRFSFPLLCTHQPKEIFEYCACLRPPMSSAV